MKYFFIGSCFTILFLAFLPLHAQDGTEEKNGTLPLSLAEALEMAKSYSWENRIKEAEVEAARYRFQQTKASFLPSVTLTESFVSTNNPLQAFGIRLLQEQVQQEDFNPARLNDPGSIENFNTQLRIEQPLINLDALNQRKAAEAGVNASSLMAIRAQNAIILEVKKAYFGLQLANEAIAVLEKAIKTAQANLALTQDLTGEGYAKNVDVMAVELRILELENDLADAKNQRSNGQDYLSYFIGNEAQVTIQPTDELQVEDDLTNLTAEAPQLAQRSDLRAMAYQIEAGERMYRAARQKFLPRLNAMASYEFNDTSPFGTGAENYLIGASLEWKIFNGGQNIAGAQKARIDWETAQMNRDSHKAKASMEVNQAQRNLLLQYNKVKTMEKAVAVAKETARIRKDRFEEGLEKTTDLLAATTEVDAQEMKYLQAVYAYNLARFNLDFLLETE